MFDDDPPNAAGHLPATISARFSWFTWISMAMMVLLSLLFLGAAARGVRAGWLAPDSVFFLDFIALVVAGVAMLTAPLLLLWAMFRGLPQLHIDRGIVRLTPVLGRVRVLHLSDFAELSLGEAVVGRGYQPRVEAMPTAPGQKIQLVPLGHFARNRAEAEALIALIRHAAGDRPKLSAAQDMQQQQFRRKEWTWLGIVIGVCVVLLILLS